ncbi:MAG: S-layer homology domain-containing protein, partial [Lachnospiraceae bacterium]|nr:S-layer homology domain-containing protein [Lachnospiraceae bacterium]
YADGDVHVGWYENSENDIYGLEGTNSIYLQHLSENGRELMADTTYHISTLRFGVLQDEIYAAITADIDGELGTLEDREIMVAKDGALTALTFNDVLDSNPQFVTLGERQCLVYYSDSNFISYDGSSEQKLLAEADPLVSDSFDVCETGEGAALVWQGRYSVQPDGGQDLYLLAYQNGAWSGTSGHNRILHTEEELDSFAVAGDENGEAVITYVLHETNEEQSGEEAVESRGESAVYAEKATVKGRIAVTALSYEKEDYVSGESFPITLTLEEDGDIPVKECSIRVEEAGRVLTEKQADTLPADGEAVEVVLSDFVPEDQGEVKTYTLSVWGDGICFLKHDITLGGVDLALSHEITYDENDRMLNVSMANLSDHDAAAKLVIATDEEESKVLYEQTFEAFGARSGQSYFCKLDTLLAGAEGADLRLTLYPINGEDAEPVDNELTIYNDTMERTALKVELDRKEAELTTGDMLQLTATVTPEDAEDTGVTWSSDNTACATVDSTGKVTALGEGLARITATAADGSFAVCTVTVKGAEVAVSSISLNETDLTLTVEERAVLHAEILPENATDQSVTWRTSDASVVEVIGGNLFAKGVGEAQITAESANGVAVTCKVTVAEADTPEPEPEPVQNPFYDVKEESWQYAAARFAFENKLMKGKDTDADGKIRFDPEGKLTRAEFAQVLYNKENTPAVVYENRFKDVPEGQWYTSAIIWAYQNGIVAGKGERYDVNGRITREEMATMFMKYAAYKSYNVSARADLGGYTDTDKISAWAVENLQWAVANGVMKGKGDRVDPVGKATRAECAAMLKNFCDAFEK